MTGASEWHRAGIAVCGVTLVLLVAAGIRFIAPPRPDHARRSPSMEMATVPTVDMAPPARTSPTSSDIAGEPATAQPRQHVAPPRRAGQVLADAVAVDGREDGKAPVLATPLVASFEIPEDSLRFEPMRLPVSTEFDELALPIAASDGGADRDAAGRGARQRDPVTAAFVTAGSAVAGGFRTAGRALRRAF
jgi:hypothetical protein